MVRREPRAIVQKPHLSPHPLTLPGTLHLYLGVGAVTLSEWICTKRELQRNPLTSAERGSEVVSPFSRVRVTDGVGVGVGSGRPEGGAGGVGLATDILSPGGSGTGKHRSAS